MASSSDNNIPSIRHTQPDSDFDDEDVSPKTTTPVKRHRTPDLRPPLLHPDSASIASSNRPTTQPRNANQPHQQSPGLSAWTSRKNSCQSSLKFFQLGINGRLEPARARSVPAWVRIQKETSEDEKRRSPSPDFRGGPGPSDNVQHPGYEPYQRVSRWERFATAYPQIDRLQEKLVDEEWLCENFGDLSGPWGPEGSGLQRPPKRRKTWRTRCHQELLYNPVVPLIIRMIVFGFSVVALALGASIRHYAEKYEHVPKGPSALMAIIVDAVALVYLIYVSYDEFRGKPLGLRSPFSKMRLILLDLFFIIFDSANLSLAFSALSDIRESCEAGNINDQFNPISNPICERQKALASVLLIALIAWVMNFSLSIFRLIVRVSGKARSS